MRNTTHELIGVSLGLAAARGLQADALQTAATAAAAFYGSWLPDVDQLGARVHRPSRLERASLPARAAGLLVRSPALAFALVARHRGITHWLLSCALVAALVALLVAPLGGMAAAVLAGGVAIGYGGHLLADACTPSGAPLLAPVVSRPICLLPRFARIPTGSLRELLLASGALLATIALLVA